MKRNRNSFSPSRADHTVFTGVILSVGALICLGYVTLYSFAKDAGFVGPGPSLKSNHNRSFIRSVPLQRVKIPILTYHYVENIKNKKDRIRSSLNVPPDIFESQIKALRDDGFTFMTADEIARVLDGRLTLPRKPIAITIDDGHWDIHTDILPILKKYNAKATAYIISGFIGGPDFLTPQQLVSVINSGLIEIGAHTMHHIELAGKLLPVIQYEVVQSKLSLEKAYGLQVTSFAYPHGSFDQLTHSEVKAAGFSTAVTTVTGIDQGYESRFHLRRINPGARDGKELLWYIQQQYQTEMNSRVAGI